MKANKLISAVLMIVLGVLFIIFKGSVISWAMTALGVLFIVMGILDIINKKTTPGIIEIVIGAIIIICGWVIVTVVLYIVAVFLILYGVYQLSLVFKYKLKGSSLIIGITSAALNLVIGICLIICQGATIDWMFIVAGIFFVLEGVLSLFVKQN